MNLQTDWQEEAKKLTEGMQPTNADVAYINGAQSYANAVEAKINEFREELKKEIIWTETDEDRNYGRQAALEELIEKLTNLTPTTNE